MAPPGGDQLRAAEGDDRRHLGGGASGGLLHGRADPKARRSRATRNSFSSFKFFQILSYDIRSFSFILFHFLMFLLPSVPFQEAGLLDEAPHPLGSEEEEAEPQLLGLGEGPKSRGGRRAGLPEVA